MMSSTMRITALALLTLGLGGCLSLTGQRTELSIYEVTLAAPATPGSPVVWQLVVDEPVADDPIAGARIVLKPASGAFGVLKGARWGNRAPEFLQALLVQGFEDSGRIVGVGRTSSSVRGDYALLAELRDFQAEYDAADGDAVAVTLSLKLVHYARNEVLAARVFRARVALDARSVGAIVAGFEQALNTLVPQIVDWTLTSGEANWAGAMPQAR
jgi:cholesterol transport system auxiliary component